MTNTPLLRATPRPFAELTAWHAAYREDILEPALPIVDPHHHAWLDGRGRYLFDDLAADVNSGHNVLATVFVQSGENMYRSNGPAEMKSVGEVEFVNGIAAMAASGRLGKAQLCAGIVGFADLALGDKVQPVLDALIAAGNGRLRGIRHNMAWDESPATADHSSINKHNPRARELCLNADFQKGVARLAQCGLSFDAWMFFPQLPELIDLLRTVGRRQGGDRVDGNRSRSNWRRRGRSCSRSASSGKRCGTGQRRGPWSMRRYLFRLSH